MIEATERHLVLSPRQSSTVLTYAKFDQLVKNEQTPNRYEVFPGLLDTAWAIKYYDFLRNETFFTEFHRVKLPTGKVHFRHYTLRLSNEQ